MKFPVFLASIGLSVALTGAGSLAYAGDSHRHTDSDEGRGSVQTAGVQEVPTTARPGEPGYGWRYFSDPIAAVGVVIGPQGEHFFSRGEGLRLLAVGRPAR